MDKDVLSRNKTAVTEKVKESAVSVLPIILIVTLLCFSISPIQTDLMLNFLIGTVMVVFGMGFFSLGAEASMIPIGNKIGTALTKSKKLSMILIFSFALGFAVTVAEPDLQVLAETVPHISNGALLVTVGIGVGFFLTICMVRILTGIKLRWLLIVFYAVLFALAAFTDADFLSIAFDSGGVTTGPMTVPFILAFGVGISNIRSDRKAEADSFGLVSLCSIGPILAVLILGFFYSDSEAVAEVSHSSFDTTAEIGRAYISALPQYMGEIALSLFPIIAIFFLFQIFSLKMTKLGLARICFGLLYTYLGLVLFLTGVNIGFSSLGAVLGEELATGWTRIIMIPLSMLSRMVHNIYRACRGSAGKSDRRSKRRSDTGKSDQTQLIYSYRHSHGYFHAESAHRHTYPVVPHTGLCHRIDPFVFRT